jgi:hypothetical protein
MMPPLVTGPIPPYNNPPIEPQFFQPSVFYISNISLGSTTTVTTTSDNNYVIGQLVRLIVPKSSGSFQLNEQLGYVIDIPAANQVVLDINSKNSDSFISTALPKQPTINAVGDINSGAINASGNMQVKTLILGSFINISPL